MFVIEYTPPRIKRYISGYIDGYISGRYPNKRSIKSPFKDGKLMRATVKVKH